ncbi:hypothetical protein [Pelagibius sp.]|uniref:hypothetical protein n=1 Tax=Pelagibius sp. TaxID=1931238 RepID=UPI003B51510D
MHTLTQGYFADPALLGHFSPFVTLPVSVVCLSLLVFYVARLAFGPRDRRVLSLAAVAVFGLFLHPFTPGLPKSFDAFAFRMNQFHQSDYDQLLQDAQQQLARLELDELTPDTQLDDQQEDLYRSWVNTHPILAVGQRSPTISATKDYVSVYWGGGLAGSYWIVVCRDARERLCSQEPLGQVRHLYERVRLQHLT